MGAEQSVPATATYQPDFLTAHVRKVSQQLAPKSAAQTQTPTQLSAIGADSLMVAHARTATANIKGSDDRQRTTKSYYAADTILNQHVQKLAAKASEPPRQTVNRPHVGGDSWLITQQKKAAQKYEHGVRNRLHLLPEKGSPDKIHQAADGYETAFAVQTKKECPGPVQSNGRTFGPEQGQATTVKLDSYYVQFGKTTHDFLLPKTAPANLAEWQGIKPTIPVADATRAQMIENETRIRESNVRTPLPAPQLPMDSFMMQFSKEVAPTPDPLRWEPPPPIEGLLAAAATDSAQPGEPVAAAAAADPAAAAPPEEVADASAGGEVGGGKPAGDSYISSFAKSVVSFTPSRKAKPPKEVTL